MTRTPAKSPEGAQKPLKKLALKKKTLRDLAVTGAASRVKGGNSSSGRVTSAGILSG